ncbi:MAG: hypothetical protein KF729_34770 [Sandaracinaceae bacterium]|nr:hypothetical protein [Sandaracinaceae bacterium]
MSARARPPTAALCLVALTACGEPPPEVLPEPSRAPPAAAAEVTPPTELAEPDEPVAVSELDALADLADEITADLGAPVRFDERTAARVRNAIRERIRTRPTLVTTRHYRRDDGSTTTLAAYTGEHLERCITTGTPPEECLLSAGPGALAVNRRGCVFGGLARIDIAPPRGEREGLLGEVTILPIGVGEICSFEVESLAVRDEDRDGAPEIVLAYAWRDLRHGEGERIVAGEGSVRLVLAADLREQVKLTMRAQHHPHAEPDGERNRVAQLRFLRRGAHRDLALDVIDWLAHPCPEPAPPWPRPDECAVRERTLVYRYDPANDRWLAPEDDPPELGPN